MDLEQLMSALAKANQHRFAVSRKKREIGALTQADGREAVAELFRTCEDEALLSGRVQEYLRSPAQVGATKSSRVMAGMGIRRADCRLRDLTMRQRNLIADAVLNGYRVDHFAVAA